MSAEYPEIAVGTVDGGLYIGLRGRATQRTCPTVEQLVNDYLAAHRQEPRILLDLDGCDWVDSTFAGWLVGLARRMQRTAGGQAYLAGCSDRCRGSLERMQLSALFQYVEAATPAEISVVTCTTGDRPNKEELKLMLGAHEALAALSEENERIFAPIVVTLRQQIENA